MIAENIKTALGEELAAKVETALKGKGKEEMCIRDRIKSCSLYYSGATPIEIFHEYSNYVNFIGRQAAKFSQ